MIIKLLLKPMLINFIKKLKDLDEVWVLIFMKNQIPFLDSIRHYKTILNYLSEMLYIILVNMIKYTQHIQR